MARTLLHSHTWQRVVVAVALVSATLLISVAIAQSTHAIDVLQQGCSSAGSGNAVCQSRGDDLGGMISNIINILLYLLGAIAVIVIIIGGIKYTTANGDASQVKSAKDTIMYAVVGLIVAIMAGAIVNFVVGRF